MAHAYTPGLKVLHETKVEKERQLPMKGDVLTDVNTLVQPADVVASTHIPGNVRMVNVANLLNIESGDVPGYMAVDIDSEVKEGALLAETGGLFGFFKSSVNSPVAGVVESVSAVTGQVVIREAPIPVEVDAYIRGIVKDVLPQEGVTIETDAAFVQGIFGIGGEKRGDLELIEGERESIVDTDNITADHAGKVLIGGAYLTLEGYRKAQQLGVAAVIVGGFNYSDLKTILGYTLGVAITGSESLKTTLIVTEGFGLVPMARRTHELLVSYIGKNVSVNGATQIRAGVMRPEIIIPLEQSELTGEHGEIDTSTGIDEGSLVRVIREPFFGQLGKVVALPSPLDSMESETEVRVAKVELPDGNVYTVPRANLELMETD